MAVVRPSRGLHLGPGEAGPAHASEALNVFWRNGELRGRNGPGYLEHSHPTGPDPYVGDSIYPTEPSVVITDSLWSAWDVPGSNCLTIGYAEQFKAFHFAANVNGIALTGALSDALKASYKDSNGDWQDLAVSWLFSREADTTSDIYAVLPLVAYDDSAAASLSLQLNGSFEPPSDWGDNTVAGQSGYWIRIWWENAGGWVLYDDVSSVNEAFVVRASTASNVVFVDTWKDRDGGVHRLCVYNSNGTLQWICDGSSYTPAETYPIDANTDIVGAYVPLRNRYEGRVKGVGWFYLNHVERTVVTKTATTGTAYDFLDRGLRSFFPVTGPAMLFESRWFTCEGAQVVWSGPGIYTDVYPNEFEDWVQDGFGSIVACIASKEWAAIFTRTACYRMASDGSADGYTFELVTGNVGCVGPRALCLVGDVVVFMAPDGVYQLDAGGNLTKQSSNINRFFQDNEITALDKIQMVYDPTFDQVRVFCCSNVESHVLDLALYADANGYVERNAGEPVQEMAWWPQGRKDYTQYGFQARYVHVDRARDIPVTLIGDEFGAVWECDQVAYEAGAITRKFLSAAVNVSSSQQGIVRWVNLSVRNHGNASFTVRVRPDGIEAEEHSVSCPVYVDAAADAIFNDTDVANDTDLVVDTPATVLMENSFEVRAQTVQVGFTHEQAFHEISVLAIEVEMNRAGKRSGK